MPMYIPLSSLTLQMMSRFYLPKNEKVLLFDINKTLYCPSEGVGLYKELSSKIDEYMSNLGTYRKGHNTAKRYAKAFGISLRGLLVDYPYIDTEDYYNQIEGAIDMRKYISKDNELIKLLKKIKGYRMYCFTNSPPQQAVRILQALGISEYFDGIFHTNYDKNYPIVCKNSPFVYELLTKLLRTCEISFFDDSKFNIKAGTAYGWDCKLITKEFNIKQALTNLMSNMSQKSDEIKNNVVEGSVCSEDIPAVVNNEVLVTEV